MPKVRFYALGTLPVSPIHWAARVCPPTWGSATIRPWLDLPDLPLAGAWTFPAGGFLGAFISGLNTARLVAEDVEGGPREGG
jgi:phytoene dehydrogenase-like protein